MAQPTLDLVTLEYPTSWEIDQVIGESSSVTLSGKVRTDILYRRYKYTLRYDMLSKNNYEILLNAINNSIDNNSFPLFTYDKFSGAESGVYVKPRLSSAQRKAGVGTEYYVSIVLELEEVNPVS